MRPGDNDSQPGRVGGEKGSLHLLFHQGNIGHERDAFNEQTNPQRNAEYYEPSRVVHDAPPLNLLYCTHISDFKEREINSLYKVTFGRMRIPSLFCALFG